MCGYFDRWQTWRTKKVVNRKSRRWFVCWFFLQIVLCVFLKLNNFLCNITLPLSPMTFKLFGENYDVLVGLQRGNCCSRLWTVSFRSVGACPPSFGEQTFLAKKRRKKFVLGKESFRLFDGCGQEAAFFATIICGTIFEWQVVFVARLYGIFGFWNAEVFET